MKLKLPAFFLVYFIVMSTVLAVTVASSRVVTTMAESRPVDRQNIIVIDAGHGGMDGGATSCNGIPESEINLSIAIRLNDLMHLLGFETIMIRTTDTSVHTEGSTIASKKISDLKERTRIVNDTSGALLLSIHQNTFSDSQYWGGQVFYRNDNISKQLAEQVQSALVENLNPGSHRKAKKADKVYLMEHIQKPGILIECGFLSNPKEEYLLRSKAYQNHLCCVIAATVSNFLSDT